MCNGGTPVRFAVYCKGTQVGEHLRVVGAHAALGCWKPTSSPVVLTTSAASFPIWYSEWVMLPQAADGGWEYKYVICSSSGSALLWEEGENRHLSFAVVVAATAAAGGNSGVTVSEVFGSIAPVKLAVAEQGPAPGAFLSGSRQPSGEAGPQAPLAQPGDDEGELLIRFETACSRTAVGEALCVVGNLGVLGSWSPAGSSADLSTSSTDFPMWSSGWVSIPHRQGQPYLCLEYKYVIIGQKGSVRWESINNRQLRLHTPDSGGRRWKCWMTLTEEFNVMGAGSASAEWDFAERRAAGGIPDLPEEVQKSLPRRKAMQRAPASFCCVSQALEPIGLQGTKVQRRTSQCLLPKVPCMRRTWTIGCIDDLPEGLTPTLRSLGLRPDDGGVESLVREAAVTEIGSTEAVVEVKGLHDRQESSMPRIPSLASNTTTEDSTTTPSDSIRQSGLEEDASSTDSSTPKEAPSEIKQRSNSFWFYSGKVLPPPRTFEERYALRECLGEGAFGVVYHCKRKDTGKECAVKVVNKDRLHGYSRVALLGDEVTGQEGEIKLHCSLPPHGHIVGLHDCFHELHMVRLVMDMCRGGDLFDAIDRARQRRCASGLALSEQAAATVVSQVLAALAFCHDHGVVHRDVKAENILLAYPEEEVPLDSEGAVVKLCDFGLSARCWASDGPALSDAVGSPDYVAPEIARREMYGQAVDVWSSGVLLFACLRARLPFPARTDQEALALVKTGNCVYDQEGWARVAPEAKACVQHLLQKSVEDRPTAKEALEHTFFQKSNRRPSTHRTIEMDCA